jgi:hypothetical protein
MAPPDDGTARKEFGKMYHMSNPRRNIVVVAGILLCIFWRLMPGQGVTTHDAKPKGVTVRSGKPFLSRFTDVAESARLAMKFDSGGEKTKRYIVEANGTGVALIDYDNDGWLDAFLVNGGTLEGSKESSRLYRNKHDGTFVDVTEGAGVHRAGWGNGICAGDINNDGYVDLFVTYWGANSLYRNNGKSEFRDIAASAGVAGDGKEWSSGCTFLDYDRDGNLDLFVTRYQEFDIRTAAPPGKTSNCIWKDMPVFCGPRGLPFGGATLYRNRGDGTFEDVSAKTKISETKGFYAFTAIAADLTGDGWTDIYVACDSTPSLLFRNNRDGTFSEVGTEAGVAFNEHGFEQGGMGVAVGDFDGDGLIDLFKTNFTGDYPNVYKNTGKGIFEDVVVKAGLAVNPKYVGWGIGLADLDNDGLPDILQVNGHVYPELDARGGPEKFRNPRLVYRNLGGGKFEDVSGQAGPGIAALHSSRGASFGDFDNDGDVDVLVMNMSERPSLLRNDLKSDRHWIGIQLEGTRSNRSAIGALVTIEDEVRRQTQPMLSQSSFVSQNDSRLHFGLGAVSKIKNIRVLWPNGSSEDFGPSEVDRIIHLREGTSHK